MKRFNGLNFLAAMLCNLVVGVSPALADQTFDQYYTIDETKLSSFFFSPQQVLNAVEIAAEAANVYLLNWTLHDQKLPVPSEKYDRDAHFGGWIKDPTKESCYNTRAQVLIRDSQVDVDLKTTNPCVVEKGGWVDPYTDEAFTSADDIQIDHVVPLKHAYVTGAWKWSSAKRCMYANFLDSDYHLLAVFGRENMKKGDKSPDQYMPPNKAFSCEYLGDWLKIKVAWQLDLTPPEADAITKLAQKYQCKKSLFSISNKELKAIRKAIANTASACN